MAIAVPSSSTCEPDIPRSSPTTTMRATALHAIVPRTRVRESSSFCRGDFVRLTEESMVAMRPISVSIAVAVTTTTPVPRVTDVFWYAMFVRSPRATSGPRSTPASFGIGADSPVSAASCVSMVAERTMRPSAGTPSPASRRTTSPGTTSTAGTSATEPSRSTRHCGTCSFDRASTLARALSSWRAPRSTLSTTSRPTRMPVDTCPMTKLTTVTATSMRFIGSRSWISATANIDGAGSPAIWFGPCCESRCAASDAVSPRSGSVRRPAATSAAARR